MGCGKWQITTIMIPFPLAGKLQLTNLLPDYIFQSHLKDTSGMDVDIIR
jgi:hypothetical protein